MARITKRRPEEEEEVSEEEVVTRRGVRKASKKAAPKKKKMEVDEDEMEEEDVEVESKNPKDHLLQGIATIRRSAIKGTTITFSRNKAPLKNVIQAICMNYSKNGSTYLSEVSFTDLYQSLTILKNLMIAEANLTAATIDEEAPDEDDDPLEGAIKTALTTERQQYLAATGQVIPQGMQELVEWIEEEGKEKTDEAKKLIEKGFVNFDGLQQVFKSGVKVVGSSRGTGVSLIGYQVVHARYHMQRAHKNLKYRWFSIQMELIVSTGNGFILISHNDTIQEFAAPIHIHNLAYRPMTDGDLHLLTERGKRYVLYSTQPHYLAYDAESFTLSGKISTAHLGQTAVGVENQLRTKGRIMIDSETGRKLGYYPAQSYRSPGSMIVQMIQQHHQQKEQKQQQMAMYASNPAYLAQLQAQQRTTSSREMKKVPDNLLFLCWPAVTGFSFTVKMWGYVLIDGLKDIQFDDRAFEQLVLAPDRKQLIHAMVKHSEVVFKDIISGKGGGSVFLLHGPPGVGKTLTAEAVAEMLHRPMYSVSMGELGTTPTEIETKLKDILDLAHIWNALVLMDEADIFLERRGQKEIIRNAMVGVVMRLIEYYQGVLFLTSNRVDVFDEAFYSRITVALKYDTLTTEVRESVWKMLLSAAKIKDINTWKLSLYPLNGRQIKNCICLAQGLAKADDSKVTQDHIDRTIKVCLEFVNEMENLAVQRRKDPVDNLSANELQI